MSFTQVILLYSQTIDVIHTSDTVILTNYWCHSHKRYCYTHKLLMAFTQAILLYSQTSDGIHTSDTVILTNYWWHGRNIA